MRKYKGLKVIRKDNKWESNASYNRFTKRITLYDRFFLLDDRIQKSILEHEYAHHVYYKMPLAYQKLWGYISNWKLIKLLNIMWITPHNKNAYTTKDPRTAVKEDWAECIEAKYLIKNKKFWTYADFKIKVAYSMYTYFSKK